MKKCVFCLDSRLDSFNAGGKTWHQCENCGGIFLDRPFLPSAEDEKARYEKHRNSAGDSGFRTYLEGFINPVLAASGTVRTVFDYGCGPEPVLVSILAEKGYDARGRDPFFAPDTACFEGGADLVTCHEVAEHFFEPRKDFMLMAALVKAGGYLAVGTMVLPDFGGADENARRRLFFQSWWYRQDSTHVSFYTPKALRLAGESAGLEWIGAVAKNGYLFRNRPTIQ